MKAARGDPPLADAGSPDDAGLTAEALGNKATADSGDHRPEVADHRMVPLGGTAAVDISVTTAHGAE